VDSTIAPPWSVPSPGEAAGARPHGRLLAAVAALADPAGRPAAARALAAAVGAADLIVLLRDAEVDLMLPAPGFPQTLPDARGWRAFAAACVARGSAAAWLRPPGRGDDPVAVRGVAGADGSVLALIGGDPSPAAAADAALLLPIVAAALRGELVAQTAAGQSAVAREAAGRANLLAATLDESRRNLQAALAEARSAGAAKDRFLAVLSHELRTPLTPVLLAATLLESDPRLAPELLADVQAIRRNAELEARLIDDLLDLTRVAHGKVQLHPQPVDAHRLLGQTLDMYRAEAHQKRLRLRYEPAAENDRLTADPARLQQVFWNLIRNAVKFTPDGGEIVVRTAGGAAGPLIVEVTDTGIGIAPDKVGAIFAAFEQGEPDVARRFGGLGLGLSISRSLVAMHGGRIAASSPGAGRGATFTVTLPTAAAAATAPAAGEPARAAATTTTTTTHAPPPARRLRILLVEDHESTSKLMVRLIRSFGHDVRAAASVGAATAAADAEPFDLLLSDVGLPDGSGLELMRDLGKRHAMRGIALTGYGMEEDVRRTAAAGFAEHMTKPIDPARLRAAIARLG